MATVTPLLDMLENIEPLSYSDQYRVDWPQLFVAGFQKGGY
jgi:hypothetical protein